VNPASTSGDAAGPPPTKTEPADAWAAPPRSAGTHLPGPSRFRGLSVIAGVVLIVWTLAHRGDSGVDEFVTRLGRVEVTARLVERPDQFPQLGAYRYTYVLRYRVLKVHRQDPAGKYLLGPGDELFVGHYKPWLPRSRIQDADWGASPLGGRLDRFTVGDAHRLALDYELQDLAPSGALDYCFPPGTNRFFALWANPTSY
jgi:hypothetical protein